ncbi:GNAT family N-acetyltransferase [Gallaecimonas sp. GXIMD4217]|uniref:GNAT family N-acetyltransferase n=1 Tax=Gallaecimonas sp. GXIMD4217 TaxID=3131927 RepID=UPI00311B2334
MLKWATEFEDLIKVFSVRAMVFMDEQKVPFSEEWDQFELQCQHLLVEEDGEPIGCGRLRLTRDGAKLERIAVRRQWRGLGLGWQITQALMLRAGELGVTRLYLNAQLEAAPLYEKAGFIRVGEPFDEAGIMHIRMEKG